MKTSMKVGLEKRGMAFSVEISSDVVLPCQYHRITVVSCDIGWSGGCVRRSLCLLRMYGQGFWAQTNSLKIIEVDQREGVYIFQ